jgi:hypothetical protein
MKRFHVHVAVHDLKQSIRFYSALFVRQRYEEQSHDGRAQGRVLRACAAMNHCTA